MAFLPEKADKSASEKMICRYLEISKFDLLQREKRDEGIWSEEAKRRSENNIEKEKENESVV